MGVAMRYDWLFERKPDVTWRQVATFILMGIALIMALDPLWERPWAATSNADVVKTEMLAIVTGIGGFALAIWAIVETARALNHLFRR
jgi:multisubunit Na+/H+ antiporter MnhB subunit